jgi:hypothetical protein
LERHTPSVAHAHERHAASTVWAVSPSDPYQLSAARMASAICARGMSGSTSALGGPASAIPCERPIDRSRTNQKRGSSAASKESRRSIRGPVLRLSWYAGVRRSSRA